MAYSDLLPMDLQEQLIQIGDEQSRMEFRVGDIVSAAIAFNRQNERAVSVMEIYSAVGAFVGKASRTVRDYHDVAAFYPYETRERFGVLRFAHFRQAMTLGGNWEKALEWAVEQVDQLGRPASVDAMIAEFMPTMEDMPVEPEFDDGAGTDDGDVVNPFNVVRGALDTLHQYLPMLDLEPGDREQVDEALHVLQEITQGVTE